MTTKRVNRVYDDRAKIKPATVGRLGGMRYSLADSAIPPEMAARATKNVRKLAPDPDLILNILGLA